MQSVWSIFIPILQSLILWLPTEAYSVGPTSGRILTRFRHWRHTMMQSFYILILPVMPTSLAIIPAFGARKVHYLRMEAKAVRDGSSSLSIWIYREDSIFMKASKTRSKTAKLNL